MSVLLEQVKAGNWVQQLRAITSAKQSRLEGEQLHPCIINDRDTLFHARDLADRNPQFYTELQAFAEREGYVLLEDRRRDDVVVTVDRRRAVLPVLVLSLGLNTGLMAAEQGPETHVSELYISETHALETYTSETHAPDTYAAHTTLALFDPHIGQSLTAEDHKHLINKGSPDIALSVSYPVDSDPMEVVLEANNNSADVEAILREHYIPASSDPDYIDSDLHAMADYFSRYPEAVSLLVSLKGHAWQLAYAKDVFETDVRGNQIQVKSVKVKFDTRAAAKLRSHRACAVTEKRGACVASPADALLHELLHAQSALLASREFIEQGGMSSVIYPFAHENVVIKSENALYKSMTVVDGSYRPNRHAHSGRVVASACVTCLN
ncbi:MAG: hypothetical protein V3T17_16370 [Pseudomonadales bacterium]